MTDTLEEASSRVTSLPAAGWTIAIGGPRGATLHALVIQLWKLLRMDSDAPEEILLWLEPPAVETAPVHLHVRATMRAEERVGRLLEEMIASASGVTLRSGPPTESEMLFAESPFRSDGMLIDRFFASLAMATDAYLGAAEYEELADQDRQGVLLELLLTGLPAAFQDEERIRNYLVFHRDWLVRYPVLHNGFGPSKAYQVLDLLQAQVERAGAPGFRSLVNEETRFVAGPLRKCWCESLRRLAGVLLQREDDPAYRIDPFAPGPLFPTFFRLFHAVARQLAVPLLEEAFLHHLTLSGLAPDAGWDRFCLAPHLHRLPEVEPASSGHAASSFQERYSWRTLVGLGGEAARSWLAMYDESTAKVGVALEQALRHLRRREVEEGYRLLSQVEEHRQEIREDRPAVFHVLGRFYHGELAYYEYVMRNLTGAEQELEEAEASVRRAIGIHRFLLPLAPLVSDVPLQKARIERSRRDWRAMEHHLQTLGAMEMGVIPLCILDDGTAVDYSLLDRYLAGRSPSEAQRMAVDAMLDPTARLREFQRLTKNLYAPPGWVSIGLPIAG